jgi:hypothetical protein
MSWRDIQARVASGGKAVQVNKPNPLKEGVSLLAKSYADKMINDSLSARERRLKQEEELKAERQRLADERREADQKEQTAQRNVSSIIQSIGKDVNNQFLRQAVYGQLQSREYDFKSTLDYFETLVKENRLKENTPAADLEGSPVAQAAVPETTRRQMEQAGLANIDALKTGGKRVGIVASLDKTESGGRLDAEAPMDEKGRVHGGRLQFGDARLKDYNAVHGTNYVAADMKNLTDEEQTKIERWHFSDIDQFIKSRGLDAYIGQEINGTVLTEASLIAMAHLGGKEGMQQYLTSGGRYNPPDANKTRLSDYARDHRDAGPLVLPGDPAPQEGLDLTQSTFDILPPKAKADEDKVPGSFEALVVANLYKSEAYQNADDAEKREMEKTALAGLTEARNASGKGSSGGVPSSLNESAVRSLYAANQLKLMSADETVRQEGENWMKVVYPTLKDALLLQLSEAKPGDDVVATVNGQNIYGKLDESRNFITADGQMIPPISAENPNGYDKVFNKDQFEQGLKSITAAGTDLDAAFEATNNTMDVVMQGYELDRLAHQYPEILTQIGGAGVSTFVSAKRELGAILDILGKGADTSIPTGSLMEEVENYLKSTDGVTAEQASVYKQFTASMIRYIFAAGKALGQTGNGFSNQDYQNIRRSLLAGNGLQEFSNNMRTFSAQRMANSDRIATGLAGRTNVSVIANLGLQLGNETMTAAQRFEELRSQDDTIPDYIGWIEGNTQFEQSPQQSSPTSSGDLPKPKSKEEREALASGTLYETPDGAIYEKQ